MSLVAVAIGLTAIFHRMRVPGGGVLAGAVAGFLLGPTLLGRMAPDWFEQVVIGGREERLALDTLKGEQAARTLARRELGIADGEQAVDSIIRRESEESLARELRAEEAWRAAQWRDREPVRITAIAGAGLFFLAAGLTRPAGNGPRPHVFQALSIGLWSAVLPGSLFLLTLRLLGVEMWSALAASSAIAAGALAFARGDLVAADDAEVGGGRLVIAGSRVALVAAMILLSISLLLAREPDRIILVAIPMAGLLLGWVLPRWTTVFALRLRDGVLIPAITALLAARIEVFEHLSLWIVVAAIVLSGDGRWFGAFLGAMLSGARRSLRTMRLVLGVMSAGTSQIAFATIALFGGLIPEEPAYALLAGALLMELTTNARRRMARRIEETEEEIEEVRMTSE